VAVNRDRVGVAAGGLLGGVLLGYAHVFVLAYMAFIVSIGGFKYVGEWAFFLNGTASALFTAMVVGLPLGCLLPRVAIPLALLIGTVAAIVLAYLGGVTTGERWWWVPLTDAVQVPIFLLLSAWLGCQLRVSRHART
jgi:hypothetical protein